MNLILARHGNTFDLQESPYYVGSQTDLPLVAFGIKQATAIGFALQQQNCHLAAVYTGPLQRMQRTAHHALLAMNCSLSIQIDQRLNELDYGLWSGLTSHEVRQRFGEDEYAAWELKSQWPKLGGWSESEQALKARILAFSQDLIANYQADDTLLVIASNGCLRYFLTLVPGAFEAKIAQEQIKIGTGQIAYLQYYNHQWTLAAWNQNPADFCFQPSQKKQ